MGSNYGQMGRGLKISNTKNIDKQRQGRSLEMWKEKYNEKLRTMEDAILSLPKNVSVVVSMAAAEAQGFL